MYITYVLHIHEHSYVHIHVHTFVQVMCTYAYIHHAWLVGYPKVLLLIHRTSQQYIQKNESASLTLRGYYLEILRLLRLLRHMAMHWQASTLTDWRGAHVNRGNLHLHMGHLRMHMLLCVCWYMCACEWYQDVCI